MNFLKDSQIKLQFLAFALLIAITRTNGILNLGPNIAAPAPSGSDPDMIKAVESAANDVSDKDFDVNIFLVQSNEKPTVYYCGITGVPVFKRKLKNDSGANIVVLDSEEDRLANYKSKSIFVILKKHKDDLYYPMYAYVRDAMPTDKSTETINKKKYVIEFDNFNFRDMQMKNKARFFGHSHCSETIFGECKQDKIYEEPKASKPAQSDKKGDIDLGKETNKLPDQNNFFFDYEQHAQGEKLVGEVVNLLVNKMFNMSGDIDDKKMKAFLDGLEKIGSLRVSVKEKKHDFYHLGLSVLMVLLEKTEENGGTQNPLKLLNMKVIEEKIKERGSSSIAGRFADDDYNGDYGDENETPGPGKGHLISLKLGKRAIFRQRAKRNPKISKKDDYGYDDDDEDDDDEKNKGSPHAPAKGRPIISLRIGRSNSNHNQEIEPELESDSDDVAIQKRYLKKPDEEDLEKIDLHTDVDLFSHLGWITQDLKEEDLMKAKDLESEPFIGFGRCPYEKVDISKITSLSNETAAIDFYLKLLRIECIAHFKEEITLLIKSDYLSLEKDKTLKVPKGSKTLKKSKLTTRETEQLSRAYELAMFSNAIKKFNKAESNGPDGEPIPNRISVLMAAILDGIDELKTSAPMHIITLIRHLASTIKTSFVKVLQDVYRLKNCKDCDSKLEKNGALNLLTAYQFVTRDMPNLGVTTKKTSELFEIYFKKNVANVKIDLDNYINAE